MLSRNQEARPDDHLIPIGPPTHRPISPSRVPVAYNATMSKIRRPCLNCGSLTSKTTRCDTCQQHHDQLYNSDYRREAKRIRDTATECWLCGHGPKADDPWQADHVVAGDSRSPLRAAHRSCNIRRGNSNATPNATPRRPIFFARQHPL